ncbi:MAG: putative glycoside hydrolase [Patescibacteria group bacterium]
MAVGVAAVGGFGWLSVNLFSTDQIRPTFQYVASQLPVEQVSVVTHLPTPSPLKAIYLTSWVAGTPARREALVKLIDETELNAVVIDIKDYTGRIAFAVTDPVLTGAVEVRIKDPQEFIRELHEKNIYVIGRISVFQDSYLAKKRPDLAVHRQSDGGIWLDRKGIAWLEAGASEVWDYVVRLAREAHALGFDELNFDYIRFPSDGNMRDVVYRFMDQKTETRAAVLERFFRYLNEQLADLNLPLSADLFGLTTTAKDDLGIGQMMIAAAPHFDYLSPMVYPSHFASGFLNYENPAAHPYEVVKHTMTEASERLLAASSTPLKLRPWLQDFDLGADYTAELVRAQIQATTDAGLDSWMLWSPSNNYTRAALDGD